MPLIKLNPQTFYTIFQPTEDLAKLALKTKNFQKHSFYYDIERQTGILLVSDENGPTAVAIYPRKITINRRFKKTVIGDKEILFKTDDLERDTEEYHKQRAIEKLTHRYHKKLSPALYLPSIDNYPYLRINPIYDSGQMKEVYGFYGSSDDPKLVTDFLVKLKKDNIIGEELLCEAASASKEITEINSPIDFVNMLLKSPGQNKEILLTICVNCIKQTGYDYQAQGDLRKTLTENLWIQQHSPQIVGIIEYISKLKETEINSIVSNMVFYPQKYKAFNQFTNRLTRIQLYDQGESEDNWSKFSEVVFRSTELKKFGHPSKCVSDFIQDWNQPHKLQVKEINLQKYLSEGWSFLRFQGRTIILKNEKDTNLLAIKIQKKDEEVLELHKQNLTVEFLAKHKKELGLQSEIPTPLGVAEIAGVGKWLERLEVDQQITEEQKMEFNKMICQMLNDVRCAYVYKAPPSYFIYLHDPNLTDEEFYLAAANALNDLLILLEQGIVYDRLADMFHNQEAGASHREDAGRYMTLVNLLRYALGGGRINAWEKAIEFINIAKKGLRDEGDWHALKAFTDSINELAQKYFKETHRIRKRNAEILIIANFIAEYFLVIELAAGKRVRNQMRQRPNFPKAAQALLWQKTVAKLHELLITRFSQFTGLPLDVARRYFNQIHDSKNYAKEMEYWMVPENYVMDMKVNHINDQIYSEHTLVETDFSKIREGTFHDKLGSSIDQKNADIGNVNAPHPIKLGECVRYDFVTKGFPTRNALIESREYYEYGKEAIREADWTTAQFYFLKSVEMNPFDSKARRYLTFVSQELAKQTGKKADIDAAKNFKNEAALAKLHRFWRVKQERKRTKNNSDNNNNAPNPNNNKK